MRTTVTLPKLGDTADEATVLEWLVATGRTVAEGEALVLVETDKVQAEVPAPVAGVLVAHLVGVDDDVPTGAALCVLEHP